MELMEATMSKHQEQFLVPMPPSTVMLACREAVTTFGWRVMEQGETRLVCKEVGPLYSLYPAQIELLCSTHPQGTQVLLNGSRFGFVSQSRSMRGEVRTLRNHIEVAL